MKKFLVLPILLISLSSCAAQTLQYSQWKEQSEASLVIFTKYPPAEAEELPEIQKSDTAEIQKARELLSEGASVIAIASWANSPTYPPEPQYLNYWQRRGQEIGANIISFFSGPDCEFNVIDGSCPVYMKTKILFLKKKK